MVISYWQILGYVFTKLIYFHLVGEYRQTTGTRDVALSNSMARPIKLNCCVLKQVSLVFPRRDILNCSYGNVFTTLIGA